MLTHPEFSPVAFSIGMLSVQWYGLMYVLGFFGGAALGACRARLPGSHWSVQQVWDVAGYIVVGVIAGGRLGYCLFYNFAWYLRHPLEIFYVWEGGMSFHGGLLGVILAMWLFSLRTRRRFIEVADFLAPFSAIGLGAGRIGNFINQELWGRPTELPWGMVFPQVDAAPRHPSQLYEAALEGIALFVILWLYSRPGRAPGKVSGLFLVCYGAFRFIVEFTRQPDAHLQYIAFGWLTMGQLLSLPMILAGLLLWHGYAARGRT